MARKNPDWLSHDELKVWVKKIKKVDCAPALDACRKALEAVDLSEEEDLYDADALLDFRIEAERAHWGVD